MGPSSRRQLLCGLSGIALGGVAGCVETLTATADGQDSTDGAASLSSGGRGATDIILHSEASRSREVTVTATRTDDEEVLLDRSLIPEPNEGEKFNNELLMDDTYDVRVEFTDDDRDSPYTETYRWPDAQDPLHVLIGEQIIFAVQVG